MNSSTNKLKFLNRDAVKYIAIFVMFWGHLFAWLASMRGEALDAMPWWQYLLSQFSLFCPPVMFFFIADGYHYTRDRKKYALRLLLFACITQIPHWLVFQPMDGWWTTNVIFTLLFGLLAIMVWESRFRKWQRILFVVLLNAATVLIMSDWAVFGVVFILFLHIFRDRPKARLVAYTSVALVWQALFVVTGAIFEIRTWTDALLRIAVVMLAYFCMTTFYNGRKGKHPVFAKWFFYAFYPLHYIVIWLIFRLTQ